MLHLIIKNNDINKKKLNLTNNKNNQVKKDAPVQPPNQLTDKNLQIVRAVSPGSDSGTDNTEYWDKK